MEQKQTRRRPNFFDILFILLILAVAAAAYLLSHGGGKTQQTAVVRSYVLELENLQEGMDSYLAVGDPVTDNVKNYDIGTVTKVEVQPYTGSVLDETAGVIKQAPIEGKISLLVTIEAETVEDADSIDTVSGYTLRTGTSVSCTIGQLTAAGYILLVER